VLFDTRICRVTSVVPCCSAFYAPSWPLRHTCHHLHLSHPLQLVTKAVAAGDDIVTADAARIGQYKAGASVAPSAADLAGRLFTTVYMGTENSSNDTRNR
jgi:hypothetical protein